MLKAGRFGGQSPSVARRFPHSTGSAQPACRAGFVRLVCKKSGETSRGRQDLSVQEEESLQCPVLRGRCDVQIDSEVGQEGIYLLRARLSGVTLVVKEDKAPNHETYASSVRREYPFR